MFEASSLTLCKQVPGLPGDCQSFRILSPFYNEYFAMQMFILRKSYSSMLYRFQVDAFLLDQSSEPGPVPQHAEVA